MYQEKKVRQSTRVLQHTTSPPDAQEEKQYYQEEGGVLFPKALKKKTGKHVHELPGKNIY
jgi:hypothetical protein